MEEWRENLRGRREFDFSVYSTGAKKGRVKDVKPIGGHDDLDVFGRFKAIELVEEFKHSSLDLGVPTTTTFNSRRSNTVDFVHENDTGGMLAGHDE